MEKFASESENGTKAVEELTAATKEAADESSEITLQILDTHRPKDNVLAGIIGPPIAKGAGYASQWSLFRQKPPPDVDVQSLLKGQAQEQTENLKELTEAVGSLAFFQRTVAALAKDDSAEQRTCTVCLEEDIPLSRLAITPCAHTFCVGCLEMTIEKFKSCSICRAPLTKKDVRPLQQEADACANAMTAAQTVGQASITGTSSSSSSSALLPPSDNKKFDKYGTKLAAVIKKLQELRQQDRTAKVILFVQFDDLKRKVAAALSEFGVPVVLLQGGVGERCNIIYDWQHNPNSPSFVLLLSLAQSASGTNLTAASHVVFLHPMLASTAELAIGHEMQAIGRARRHGQMRDTVHVWRFVTAETIDQTLTERHQSGLWKRESDRREAAQAAAAVPAVDAGDAAADNADDAAAESSGEQGGEL